MPTEIWPTERNSCSSPKFLEQCNQNGSIFCNECHIFAFGNILRFARRIWTHLNISESMWSTYLISRPLRRQPLFLYHIPFIIVFLALSLPSQAVSIYLTADKMVMNWSKEINCYFCKTCALHKRAKEHMLCSFCPYFFNASFFSHSRLSEYIWHRIE